MLQDSIVLGKPMMIEDVKETQPKYLKNIIN